MMSRYESKDYPEAVSRAERFVDDTTWLRMSRLRAPSVKTELFGVTSDTIKAIHLADATLERWGNVADAGTPFEGVVDFAYRFPDGSLAIRIATTKRWEVWRTW